MTTGDGLSAAILAAGKGTRMRNPLPKVLHKLAGLSLIGHVLNLAREAGADPAVTVLSPDLPDVAAEVERLRPGTKIAWQSPQLGTGHALQVAAPHLPDEGVALILYGDTPLTTPATLRRLVAELRERDAAVAVLGMRPPDPTGYGRLRLGGDGSLVELVEERHADDDLKRNGSCNSGVMALNSARMRPLLDGLRLREEKNEYYLTDVVADAVARGWRCAWVEGHWHEGHGVNSQAQLAQAHAILQSRLLERHHAAGVIVPAPEGVCFAHDTSIGPGASIGPHVVFGPGVSVAGGAVVEAFSHLEGCEVGPGAKVGPYARLRPGTVVGEGARVGNFVEAKAARLGVGAKANHLTYLGDCEVGNGANVGAGTITCNYDGFAKHRTEIGEGAFVGSNTALVAPVRVGEGAIVGAGSTVTRDVPDGAVAVARGAQHNHEGAAATLKSNLRARKESQA